MPSTRRADRPEGSERTEGAAPSSVRCPLCGRHVPASSADDTPAALNRHFETDCTWRHTNRSPTRPAGGR